MPRVTIQAVLPCKVNANDQMATEQISISTMDKFLKQALEVVTPLIK